MVGKLELQRWKTRRLLHRAFNSKEGVVKINVNNSFAHELAKFLLCWELAQQGKEFIVEAVFENNKRADVLVLDDFEALEIVHSERLESIDLKRELYPVPITVCEAGKIVADNVTKIHDVIAGGE